MAGVCRGDRAGSRGRVDVQSLMAGVCRGVRAGKRGRYLGPKWHFWGFA